MTQIEKLKKLLEVSILFTPEQKQGWLKLLPQMTQSELDELHEILKEEVQELKAEGYNIIEDSKLESELISKESLPTQATHGASIEALKAAAAPQKVNTAFNSELKREVETLELRKPTAEEMAPPVLPKPIVKPPEVVHRPIPIPTTPVVPKSPNLPKGLHVPTAPSHKEEVLPSGALKSLIDIRSVDDLKRIRTLNLRQGELSAQIDLIRAKILSLAQSNRLLPFYTVGAFEESLLYKNYLAIGASIIANPDLDRSKAFEKSEGIAGDDKLTLREFEAIADLRKQIEQF